MGRKKVRLPGRVEDALDTALDRALKIQRPVVLAYLDRVRSAKPDATPAEVIAQLERRYRAAVIGIGGASGAAAAVPGAGTAASLATGAAEIAAFVSATAMYVLAMAELHALPVSDPELRRALVLAVLVGEGAELAIEGSAMRSTHWAEVLTRSNNKETIGGINARLGRLLLTRFGARQGALLFGRAIPLGIGAGVGAVGNAALARMAIKAAHKTFGPPPRTFPPRVVDARAIEG
jgi:hypothetical protein